MTAAQSPVRSGRARRRPGEPPDPPARRRPHRLLHVAVRAAQLHPGRPAGGAQRRPRQLPQDRRGVQPSPGHDHQRRRRGAGPLRPSRTTRSSSSGSTRRASCSATSPATSTSTSAPRPRGDLQRRARPAGPPRSTCATCPTCSSTTRTWATSPSRSARTCSRWPATRSATRPARSSRSTRGRLGPRLLEQPVVRPQPAVGPRPRRPARSRSSSRRRRASRCCPKMYRELFFPGSTFKVVTGSIGVDTGKVTPDQPVYPVETGYDIDFTERDLRNFGGSACGGDAVRDPAGSRATARSPRWATRRSAHAGMVAGRGARSASTHGRRSTCPAPAASRFPTEFPADQGNGPIARASIGQGDTASTPLQMALVAAGDGQRGPDHGAPPAPEDHATPTAATIRDAEGRSRGRTAIEPGQRGDHAPGDDRRGPGRHRQPARRSPASRWAARPAPPSSAPSRPGRTPGSSASPGRPGQPARVAVAVIVEGQPGASEQTGGRVAAPIAQAVDGQASSRRSDALPLTPTPT